MKVKRSSWHYRLTTKFSDDIEFYGRNLCRYFWRVVGSLCILFFGLLCLAALVLLASVWFLDPFWASNTIVAGFILLAVFLPLLAISLLRWKFGIVRGPQPSPLIVEYLKAKKQKICPEIEFID